MLVAGCLIQTLPGRALPVAKRMSATPEIKIQGTDGKSRIAMVWSGESATAFERFARVLLHTDSDVLGVFPTFSAG